MFFVLMMLKLPLVSFTPFFFNDTATTEIYTLSLHDALPICIIFLVPVAVLALWLWKQNRRASVFLTTLLALNCLLIGLINSSHPNRSHGSLYPLVIYETVNFLQPRPMNLWVASPRVSQKTV